jgi:VIT1/CCC1 family predicted Fe2+/Mn2+ transporter
MPDDPVKSSKRVLEPHERIAEVLFGLIMVLTFTGSLSVAQSGRAEVRTMLIGALGCNIAWGIIDGVFYLMGCLADKSQSLFAYHSLRKTADAKKAQEIISGAMPPVLASVLTPEEFQGIHQRLNQLPEPPGRVHLRSDDWLGALGVFLLVFLCTFPVVIPFIFMQSLMAAMRTSNGIAIVMLFLAGYVFGRITGRNRVAMGVGMVIVGAVLVAITIALGG